MNVRDQIQIKVKKLEDRYDAEHDIVAGQPVVNFADITLVEIIKDQMILIDGLQKQIDTLRDGITQVVNRAW